VIQVAPNPTTGMTEVSLPNSDGGWIWVYHSGGQKIKSIAIPPGTPKLSLDLEQYPT
jgi:hypothetical protein